MAMRVVGLLVLICAAECVTAGASKLNDTSPINKLENLQDGWAIVLPEEDQRINLQENRDPTLSNSEWKDEEDT